jgi:hypothetical protein
VLAEQIVSGEKVVFLQSLPFLPERGSKRSAALLTENKTADPFRIKIAKNA